MDVLPPPVFNEPACRSTALSRHGTPMRHDGEVPSPNGRPFARCSAKDARQLTRRASAAKKLPEVPPQRHRQRQRQKRERAVVSRSVGGVEPSRARAEEECQSDCRADENLMGSEKPHAAEFRTRAPSRKTTVPRFFFCRIRGPRPLWGEDADLTPLGALL
jgi:hypothetical protein